MSIMNWVNILYGITASAFGLYTSGIGIWGLVKKRPIVFASRQLMWFMLATFVPSIILFLSFLFEERNFINSSLAIFFIPQVVLMVLLVFILWRQMSGYMIFGVSDETFREALTNALNKLNLPYQETISKIKLTSLDADLQAAVASWMGTAQIRIKQYQHIRYTQDIANAMKEYYRNNPVKVNNFSFIVYLLLGISMIGFALLFPFGFSFMIKSF